VASRPKTVRVVRNLRSSALIEDITLIPPP
jgi:hypothetical protein